MFSLFRFAALGLVCLASIAQARTAILEWDPVTTLSNGNPPPAPIQYKVYMGTSSGNYSQIEVATLVQLINGRVLHSRDLAFADDVDVYFVVTAFYINQVNQTIESGYSNEVVQRGKIKLQPPAPPEIIGGLPSHDRLALASKTIEYSYLTLADQELRFNERGQIIVSRSLITYLQGKHPELLNGGLVLTLEVHGKIYEVAE
ncbi:MAG: hypothetical protein IT288_16220 [Bdellovibrionales bacterium]|nr:hypothetical protein [Bdellovibrionales bacterium]